MLPQLLWRLNVIHAAPKDIRVMVATVVTVPGIDIRPHVVDGRLKGLVVSHILKDGVGAEEYQFYQFAIFQTFRHV